MIIYSLDVLLFLFGTSRCSKSSSNCCFLACIQISQEAGQVVWYSYLFQNFQQFIVIHTVSGFGIVNKAAPAAKSCQSCPTLCDPIDGSPLGSPPWDYPSKNTGMGCHFLLQCVKVKMKLLSSVRLFTTPRIVAYQAPPSMGFPRQEYWSELPLPSPY